MPRQGLADIALQLSAVDNRDLSGTIGAQIVSDDAPYLKSLRRLPQRGLSPILEALQTRAKQIHEDLARRDIMTPAPIPVLKVLDIKDDQTVEEMASMGLIQLGGGIAEQARERTRAINQLVELLHSSSDHVHTRVILLMTGWKRNGILSGYYETGQAAAEMLFAHILGEEYKLPPLDVARLCQFQQLRDVSAMHGGNLALYPTMDPYMASLGNQYVEGGGCLIQWLGQIPTGRHSVYTVVARVSEHWDDTPTSIDSKELYQVPLISSIPYGPPRRGVDTNHGLSRLLDDKLREILVTLRTTVAIGTPMKPNIPSLHWLVAMLQLAHSALHQDYVTFKEDWQRLQRSNRQPEEELKLNSKIKKLRAAVISTQSQAISLSEWIHDADSTETIPLNSKMAILLMSIDHLVEEVEDSAEAGIKIRGLEMTETSIKENKSAIALTILAYFFIPLNLASSIFGMNVQEINGTGHEITVFVIVALAAVTISLMALFYWRVSTQRPKYLQKYKRYEQRTIQARKIVGHQAEGIIERILRPWDRYIERRDGVSIDF